MEVKSPYLTWSGNVWIPEKNAKLYMYILIPKLPLIDLYKKYTQQYRCIKIKLF